MLITDSLSQSQSQPESELESELESRRLDSSLIVGKLFSHINYVYRMRLLIFFLTLTLSFTIYLFDRPAITETNS